MTLFQQQPRPLCNICNETPVKAKGKTKNGFRKWGTICNPCTRKPYRQYKKDSCEECGFIPKWKGQLDIDHIDGNHNNNNEESNLQTLCANCHRYKTYLKEDWQT